MAIILIVWLLVAPWLSLNDKQLVFFDIAHRKIQFFGLTFWINQLPIFLFFALSFLSLVLLFTATLGRVFCGWACPQTVFMEFVFRPIERWLEGSGFGQREFLKRPLSERFAPQFLKWSLFFIVAVALGNTFVAYFFGSSQLIQMILEGPKDHLGPFLGMIISSLVILFQFGWFREQVCLFVCPYGRLQSILLDPNSLIVAYDTKRGEPRGKPSQATGDCVDCKLCIKVCPTGIDIRQGLQMECLHCTQCIDACDSVMEKLERPLGLIRYQTETELEGKSRKIIRPRVIVYSLICLILTSALFIITSQRKSFSIVLHRESGGAMFTLDEEGNVVNQVRIQAANYAEEKTKIHFKAVQPADLVIISPEGEIELQAEEKRTTHILLKLPVTTMKSLGGVASTRISAENDKGLQLEFDIKVMGPAH